MVCVGTFPAEKKKVSPVSTLDQRDLPDARQSAGNARYDAYRSTNRP